LSAGNSSGSFEQDLLPHLNSAYNLARWLTRNEQDAQDIVQEAYLRAFNAYRGFRRGNARPWLMRIVRNVFYTSLQKNASHLFVDFDDDLFVSGQHSMSPEQRLIDESNGLLIRRALAMLHTRSREVLVLREIEDMSYREISKIMDMPTGTVMSTLSRTRARLRQLVTALTDAKL
jgi:RNA polymerase sigma factor (sigma-70 family)